MILKKKKKEAKKKNIIYYTDRNIFTTQLINLMTKQPYLARFTWFKCEEHIYYTEGT